MRLSPFAAAGLAVACAPAATQAAADGPQLVLPIACQPGRTCEVQHYVDRDPGPAAQDYRCGRRTYDGHKGVDLRVPDMAAQRRGVDVLAAAQGRVARLRDGTPDISIRAPGAPAVTARECGNGVIIDHGGGWETQYCHLARGSLRVKAGDTVAAGQPIARVGLSGATEFPHLHFQLQRAGQIVDPFGGGCAGKGEPSRWTPAAQAAMAYKAGAVLNVGFAGGPVTMADVEAGGIVPPGAGSGYLVVYGRAIGLMKGDEIELVMTAPGGGELARTRLAPLDRDKAQYIAYVGKKRPPAGWDSGAYAARLRVHRAGRVALDRGFTTRM